MNYRINKLLQKSGYVIFLVIMSISCTDKKNEALSEKRNSGKADKVVEAEPEVSEPHKHFTFTDVIDSLPENINHFIPEGFSAIDTSYGNLNQDSISDMILVLRKNTEETTSDYDNGKPEKRPLLLLLGQADNTYRLVRRNDEAVSCIDCAGVFGDPFSGITIKNGYFSIELAISGGRHWEQVITFKYDRNKSDWFLYKDHYLSYKLNDSEDEDAEVLIKDVDNLKTVKDFGIVPFSEYNYYTE